MNMPSVYIFHVVAPCLVLDQMGITLNIFRFHFDDLFALLKAKGVTELAIYQKGKRIMVPLPV